MCICIVHIYVSKSSDKHKSLNNSMVGSNSDNSICLLRWAFIHYNLKIR